MRNCLHEKISFQNLLYFCCSKWSFTLFIALPLQENIMWIILSFLSWSEPYWWHVIYPKCWYSWDCQLVNSCMNCLHQVQWQKHFHCLFLTQAINQANHWLISTAPNCSYVFEINFLLFWTFYKYLILHSKKKWMFLTYSYSFFHILSFWPRWEKQLCFLPQLVPQDSFAQSKFPNNLNLCPIETKTH